MSSRNITPLAPHVAEAVTAAPAQPVARRVLRFGVVVMVAVYCAAAWTAIGWVASAALHLGPHG